MKETLSEAAYRHIRQIGEGIHILLSDTGNYELWTARKNHASYGIRYKNTHLEFCATIGGADAEILL